MRSWTVLLEKNHGPLPGGKMPPQRSSQAAVERGEMWGDDGTRIAVRIPVAAMSEVCNVGPQHRQNQGIDRCFRWVPRTE